MSEEVKEKKQGRPLDYTEEIAEEICAAIAESNKSLAALCSENPHWATPNTIRRWIRTIENFRYKYAQAKEDQANLLVDEILEIADDKSKDNLIRVDKNGEEYEVCNSEWINRSRLRVDTRKWLASKLYPKMYGDKGPAQSEEKDSSEVNEDRHLVQKCIEPIS